MGGAARGAGSEGFGVCDGVSGPESPSDEELSHLGFGCHAPVGGHRPDLHSNSRPWKDDS